MTVLPMVIIFAVVLFVVPYFLLTGVVFIAYLSKRTRARGQFLLVLLCLPICLFSLSWLLSIKTPDRDDIKGHYVIARSKWPGRNADWQHETYTLEITETQAIVRDARTKTVWKYGIEWSEIYEHRWGFADFTKRHHIIANGPTLYRGRFGHHYVFYSPLYGNVFFEKE
jgi:hypothetical protein